MRQFIAILLLLAVAACARSPAPPPVSGGVVPALLQPAPSFDDADPHPGVGSRPARYPVHGIDLSRWQGAVDWPVARRAGIAFAYLKLTEGGDRLDPAFAGYLDGAQAAGVRAGAYHYYYFCTAPEVQAEWFLRHLPQAADMLPPVLDLEWNPRSPTCRRRPDPAVVRGEAQTFLDIVARRTGRRPLVYSTVDFFHENRLDLLPGARFWLRSVAAPPEETYPAVPWQLWQYTGTGLVPGVARPVDINVFAGSAADWAIWR